MFRIVTFRNELLKCRVVLRYYCFFTYIYFSVSGNKICIAYVHLISDLFCFLCVCGVCVLISVGTCMSVYRSMCTCMYTHIFVGLRLISGVFPQLLSIFIFKNQNIISLFPFFLLSLQPLLYTCPFSPLNP